MQTADPTWVKASQLRKRKLRYGFKAQAKREAKALRSKHGYGELVPVDAIELAEAMGIAIAPVSSFGDRDAVRQVTDVDPNCFSAAIVRYQQRITILHQDSHAIERQMSNVAHEIGHLVLNHEDAPPLSPEGCRELHADMESEADYFGSVLLVPDEAVMHLARRGQSIAESAEFLGVSTQMMQWRYNDSGAAKRLARRK